MFKCSYVREIRITYVTFILNFFRFLALPSLIQVPRDRHRLTQRRPPRRIYEVEPEVLGARHVMWTPVALELDFSEQYRQELATAFANVYLVSENAAVISVMHRIPLRHLLDLRRVQSAREACNGQDPIALHLNPLLQQIGHPLM
jgi:hypothetical protein